MVSTTDYPLATYDGPADDGGVDEQDDLLSHTSIAAAFAEASKPDMPEIRSATDGQVTLVYGMEQDGIRVRTARVRELRGTDEEALAKLNASRPDYYAKLTDMILMRATESIGDIAQATQPKELHEAIGNLLMVDRDVLFMEILIATYGETKEYSEIQCPTCGTYTDFEVDIRGMVEIKELPEPDSPYVKVKLRKGQELLLHYPTGKDQLFVFDVKQDANDAEQNTFMIERCIESEVGVPKREFARNLSIDDRRRIVEALQKGPSLTFREVPVSCQSCNSVIPFAFGWADLLLV